MTLPPNLPPCDPDARFFPSAWKESYFRRHFDAAAGGYVCPGCGQVFRGTEGFKRLQADHRVPWSQGGKTVWDNLILLCGPCNLAKSDGRA